MLAATGVIMSDSEKKKVNKNTYDISSIKRVTNNNNNNISFICMTIIM